MWKVLLVETNTEKYHLTLQFQTDERNEAFISYFYSGDGREQNLVKRDPHIQ